MLNLHKMDPSLNWSILSCIAIVCLSCTIFSNSASANPNSLRPKRHVGVFFKHLQPIIENPEIFHDAELSETTIGPDSVNAMDDVTTTSPNDDDKTDAPEVGKMTSDDENKNMSDMPSSQNVTAETTPSPNAQDKMAKDDTATDTPNQTSPVPNPDSDNPTQSTNPTSDTNSPDKPDDKSGSETTIQPGLNDDENSSSAPNGDSTSAPSPAPASSPESSTDSSVAPLNETDTTQVPDDNSAPSGPPNARKPKTLSDDGTTQMPLSDETTNPSATEDTDQESQTPAVAAPAAVNPNTDSPDTETTTPAMCSSPSVPEPKSENIDASAAQTTTASPEGPTTTPSTKSTTKEAESLNEQDEDDEDLEAISQLLDKLNAQKKLLDEQIANSKKSLESITEIMNNDKNRKINDVIDRVNEEEVKPLADVLNEDTGAYDKVLDPAVVSAYAANDSVRGQTKQWIIARIAIPAQFQLMQSYLCLKMVSPDVNFQQRLGVIGLFTETHIDCLRNRQHELRAPLEAMIVRLTCITKCTDPGKIPNSWQPNNYLNRGAMEQIQQCNQPDAFYATNPLGRNTIVFRTIQDDYQNGVGTFENIQRNFAQQVSLANQEVGRMQQECEKQRQHLAREQVPPVPSNTYLPAPPDSGWNTPQASSPVPALALPSGQWYVGQWRPSLPNPSYSAPRWNRQV